MNALSRCGISDLSPPEPARAAQLPFMLALGSFYLGRFDEAVSKLLLSTQEYPAASYAHMGRLHDAHAIIAQLRAITSRVVPSILPWRKPENRELFLSGLRLAASEAR